MSTVDDFNLVSDTLSREKQLLDSVRDLNPTESKQLLLLKTNETEYQKELINKLSDENQKLKDDYVEYQRKKQRSLLHDTGALFFSGWTSYWVSFALTPIISDLEGFWQGFFPFGMVILGLFAFGIFHFVTK